MALAGFSLHASQQKQNTGISTKMPCMRACMAATIPELWVSQHLVGLSQLLKLLFGKGVPRVLVGVHPAPCDTMQQENM